MTPSLLAQRLSATTLFSRLPGDTLRALLERSPRQRAAAGESLAQPAQGLKHHVVLLDGALEARRSWTDDNGAEYTSVWRVAVEPDGPGFALLSAAGSRIGVHAVSDAEWVAVNADELDRLLDWSDLGGSPLLERHLKIFHTVPLENVQQAFERMVERPVAAGETIVTQGEPGDSYYVILAGEAEVLVTDPISDETRRAPVLGEGDAFGEEALLLEGNRTATVRMITPGRLLVLAKADFDALLRPRMVAVVDAAEARAMLAAGKARLLDCRYEMEYQESRIPGAQLVPLQSLRHQGVFTLDPAQDYIVYCRSGRRSSAAAFLLRERGIRAWSMTGGIRDWPYEIDSSPV
ncbi:MAG: cyclic nucleotide-binding domain-containing protein [Betaproteobacteria bacterium]